MPLIISYASRTASRRRSASTGLGDLLHEADSGARREFLPRIHPRRLSARQAKRRSRPWIETVRKVCGINTMTLPARLETSSDLQQERPRWGSNPGPMVNAGRFLLASAFRVHAGQPAFTRPLPLCQKTDTDRGRHATPPLSPRKGNGSPHPPLLKIRPLQRYLAFTPANLHEHNSVFASGERSENG